MDILDNITFVCKEHQDKFKICFGKYSLYYRCPHYERQNRKRGEPVCMNRLSIKDTDYIKDDLEKLFEMNKVKKEYKGKICHLEYTIEDINEYEIIISVKNNKKRGVESGNNI